MNPTRPKPFVFILMPFSGEFDDVYKLGIRPACEDVGAYAERVDEQLFVGSITQRIYNQISKADVIVADMTGRNPNVFYEVGYAHALGKPVVLLSRNTEDIPFDLKDYPHIIYAGRIADLIPNLTKKVGWCLENRGDSLPQTLSHISIYFQGSGIGKSTVIMYCTEHPHTNGYWLTFDINNSAERIMRTEKFVFSLAAPAHYEHVTLSKETGRRFTDFHMPPRDGELLNAVQLPDSRLLHVLREPIVVYPGGWASVRLFLSVGTSISEDTVEEMALRINTESATRDYPFSLAILLSQEAHRFEVSG
jgi:Nucleoside 2-deoxyribosyltransferase